VSTSEPEIVEQEGKLDVQQLSLTPLYNSPSLVDTACTSGHLGRFPLQTASQFLCVLDLSAVWAASLHSFEACIAQEASAVGPCIGLAPAHMCSVCCGYTEAGEPALRVLEFPCLTFVQPDMKMAKDKHLIDPSLPSTCVRACTPAPSLLTLHIRTPREIPSADRITQRRSSFSSAGTTGA
jgi:hypothetical protein